MGEGEGLEGGELGKASPTSGAQAGEGKWGRVRRSELPWTNLDARHWMVSTNW